jgi:tRNA(fMet)-specific endonuclease VapC
MPPSLLDTDTLSELFKQKNPTVVGHGSAYLTQYGRFNFSSMTRYEVARGFKAKGAIRQFQQFLAFCQQAVILPVTDAILDRTADLWATASLAGRPRNDADLIIAATALEHGMILVTGNGPHYERRNRPFNQYDGNWIAPSSLSNPFDSAECETARTSRGLLSTITARFISRTPWL